ncbi:hypothetical protein ACLOJK_038982, partial [Asimina triloba]
MDPVSLLSLSNKVLVEVRSLSNSVLMKVRSLSNKVLLVEVRWLSNKVLMKVRSLSNKLVVNRAVDEIWTRTSEGIHVESHLMQVRHFWLLSQRMRMRKPTKELRRPLSLGINKLQGPFPDFPSKGRVWQLDSDDAPGSGGRVWISREPPRFLLQWVVICFPLARGCHYPKPGHWESDIPEDLFAERKSTSSLSAGETAGIVVGVKKGYITGPETLKLNGNVVNGNGVGSDMNSLNCSGHGNVNVFEIGSLVISINGLHLATNNFSEENIVGKEGFGVVYKGVFRDGSQVAVKRIEAAVISSKGLNELQAEIAVLTKVRHRHLVDLKGYCTDGNEKLLVYEYMPNGTFGAASGRSGTADSIRNTLDPTLHHDEKMFSGIKALAELAGHCCHHPNLGWLTILFE